MTAQLEKGKEFESNACRVIGEKNSYAKHYFQLTIVEMEMQQIAESILRVTKRIPRRRLNCSNLSIILSEAERNRPAILNMFIKQRTA